MKSTPTARPKYLNLDEAAEILHVHRKTIVAMIARGDLVASRVGDHPKAPYLIPEDEPYRYLEERRVEPVAS